MKTNHFPPTYCIMLLLAGPACFRQGGGTGGGGCGVGDDAGADALTGTYRGDFTASGSALSMTATGSDTITVTGLGARLVQVRFASFVGKGACTLTAEVDGCVARPTPDQSCFGGGARIEGGTFTFGAETLTVDLQGTDERGVGRFTYHFNTAQTPVSGACRDACDHGRRLGCSQCLSSNCETDCAARWSSPAILSRMLATEQCRVDYGGDTADQCDRP